MNLKTPEELNKETQESALRQWNDERARRITEFTLATMRLLHAEALTVTQVKAIVEQAAIALRAQGKVILDQ